MNRKLMRVLVAVFILASISVNIVGVSAQADPTPITLGENKIGQVNGGETATFALTVDSAQTINIQLLGVSQGFAGSFTVLDAVNLLIASAPNAAGANVVQAAVTLSTPGRYLIGVTGVNGLGGQFLLSAQAGGALLLPDGLPIDTPLSDTVNQTNSRRAYTFFGTPDAILLLTARGGDGTTNSSFLLRDATTNALLGASSARLGGAAFRIPASGSQYLLEVLHSGASGTENFSVCLARENAPQRCTGGAPVVPGGAAVIPTVSVSLPTQVPPPQVAPPQATFTPVIVTNPPPAIVLPALPTTGGCVIAPSSATSVNVRSGPALTFGVVAQLPYTQYAGVTGRLGDNSWYQVNYNGLAGWIAASVVRLGGNCGGIPVIGLTATPPLVGLVSATPSPTLTLTLTPSLTPTTPPAPVATLNFTASPNFGSTALTSGFHPDPFTQGITSGGSVNVSYLGGGCTGFATSAPDFSITYTSGAFTLLRFYFVGNGDTTMIINTPNANYVCADDSFGTRNPAIDFNNPSSGRYDIWIGSFSSGTSINGTLNVTESPNNRP